MAAESILSPIYSLIDAPLSGARSASSGRTLTNTNLWKKKYRNIFKYFPPQMKSRIRWYLLGDRVRFIKDIKKSMIDADVVILGGGQLIKNNIALFCDRIHALNALLVKSNLPYLLIGVGVDDKMNLLTWSLVRNFMERCTVILVRDPISKSAVLSNCNVTGKLSVVPDLVFSLKNPALNDFNTERGKTIGINIMCFSTALEGGTNVSRLEVTDIASGYVRLVEKAINDGFSVQLFTSGSDEDLVAADYISNIILDRIGVKLSVVHPDNLDRLLEFLVSMQDVISARMHVGILAYISRCNPVCLNWDNKVQGVWSVINEDERVFDLVDIIDTGRMDAVLKKLSLLMPPTAEALAVLAADVRSGLLQELSTPTCLKSGI